MKRTITHDKFLNHHREFDGITSYQNILELSWYYGKYIGQTAIVLNPIKSIYMRDWSSWAFLTAAFQEKTNDPTGFTDPENIVVTYDSINRTITLTGNVEAYYKWELVEELVSWRTSQPHSSAPWNYFLHYCEHWFAFDTTPWEFDCLQIAYTQWNWYKIGVRECHWLMQWQTHKEFHETIWTYRSAWWDFSWFTLNSSLAADRRPNIAELTIYDEDLKSIIPLLNSKKYTHRYLSWAGARTFDIQQDDFIKQNWTVPRYNVFSWWVWSFADIPTSQYAAIFVVWIPATADSVSQEYRYMFVQPQTYWSLAQIQALTPQNLNHWDTASLVSEFVFFWKIIIQSIWWNRQIKSVELLTGTRVNQVSVSWNFLSVVNTDLTLTWNWTAGNPLSVLKTRTDLATRRTAEPVTYDTQPTYEVLEYTYWTTKYYRRVYNTYSPSTDIFYAEPWLTTVIANRALSI